MKEKCGCQGANYCLVCRQDLSYSNDQTKKLKQFIYCALCGEKAFRLGLDDHESHLDENLIEFVDYLRIDGVLVCDEVINLEQENQLVNRIDEDEWTISQSGRKKQDFGPKINFKKKKLKLDDFIGLPALQMVILEQLINSNKVIRDKLKDFRVIEICNLEYRRDRGSCIGEHYDDFYFWGNRIVTLSLLSSTKLILTKEHSNKQNEVNQLDQSDRTLDTVEIVIQLNRRSLVILNDEARYNWLHGIRREHIEDRRLAITYRELSKQLQPDNTLINNQIDQLLTLASNRIV